jgi:hypothetical protein
MARRKQQNPQPKRGAPAEEPADASGPEESDVDLALEAWEEEHAYVSRPKKRQKKSAAQLGPPQLRFATCAQPWQCAAVAHEAFGDGALAALQRAERITVEPSGDDPASLEVRIPGASADGAPAARIPTPSPEVATCLAALLQKGHLVLGPLAAAPSPPASDCQPSTSAAAAAPARVPLTAGLAVAGAALADGAEWAEDERQRPWQAQLLRVLRWALPQAGLDPEVDLQERPELASSPLCSPRRKAAAAVTGGSSPPTSPRGPGSPRSTQAAAEQASFDAAELYAAVRPSGDEPELTAALPELQPTLRRYQRRAAQWMVGRETGTGVGQQGGGNALHPLWRAVPCAGGRRLYVNAYTGRTSMQRFPAPPPLKGEARHWR